MIVTRCRSNGDLVTATVLSLINTTKPPKCVDRLARTTLLGELIFSGREPPHLFRGCVVSRAKLVIDKYGTRVAKAADDVPSAYQC